MYDATCQERNIHLCTIYMWLASALMSMFYNDIMDLIHLGILLQPFVPLVVMQWGVTATVLESACK